MTKKHFFNLPDGFALLNDPTYHLLIRCEWRGKIRQHGFPRKSRKFPRLNRG